MTFTYWLLSFHDAYIVLIWLCSIQIINEEMYCNIYVYNILSLFKFVFFFFPFFYYAFLLLLLLPNVNQITRRASAQND